MVGHEERVELPGFELLNQALDVREIEIGVRSGAGITPRAGVNTDRPHERAELELTLWHCLILNLVIPGCASWRRPGIHTLRWWLWIPGSLASARAPE
jgi:hypothetical protein